MLEDIVKVKLCHSGYHQLVEHFDDKGLVNFRGES